MSPIREGESLEDYVKRLEATQKRHERIIPLIQEQVQSLENRMTSLEPVLADMSGKLSILVDEKKERDVIAKYNATKPKTWADKLKEKLMDSLSTIISGALLAFVFYLILEFLKTDLARKLFGG